MLWNGHEEGAHLPEVGGDGGEHIKYHLFIFDQSTTISTTTITTINRS